MICLALTIIIVARRVMLLPLGVAALLSLPQFVIVRLGVLGTIRISILNQSSHKCSHVIAVTLEPSQVQLQRLKPAIALQRYDWRIGIDAVR